MKKPLALAFLILSLMLAVFATSAHPASAGLFGSGKKATPTPSPAPAPTATPEPPAVAIPRLEKKLKANPKDQQAAVELAGQYLTINRPDLAAPLTEQLLKAGVKSAQVYYFDGVVQQAAGNMSGALNDFQQASDLDPTNTAVLGQLAQLYLQMNRSSDALRIANRAVIFNKTDPQSYLLLGSVYAQQKRYDDARAQYEKAVALDPENSQPIVQIANTYAAQNNIPKALATMDRALKINPMDVQSLVYKADLYAKQHDDANVGNAYDDAVVAAKSDNQKVAILARKASYYIDDKKPQIAESVFKQMVARYPTSADAFITYGDFLSTEKRHADAVVQWEKALKLDPKSPEALVRLGQDAIAGHRIAAGIAYLSTLTTVAPLAENFALLGQAYSFAHDYQSAKTACVKSFNLNRTPDTLACIAGSDFELKKYKEATQIFDTLAQRAPDYLLSNPQLLYVAAKSYAHTGEKTKAMLIFKRLLAATKKNSKAYKQIQGDISDLNKSKGH